MEAFIQSEAAECGLACLAMVATHHGHRTRLSELRRLFSISLNGSTLAQVMEIGGKMGLVCRPLRLDLEHIRNLQLPCILHWDLNHFVVLRAVGRKVVTVFDPAVGERKMKMGEFSRSFTGVALELIPGADFRRSQRPPAVAISRLTGKVGGLRRAIGLILILSLALQVFVLMAPFFIQWVVDQVLVAADRDLLTVLCLGFGLALVLQLGIGAVRGWAVIHLSSRLGVQWTGNVFFHLIRLPMEFYGKRHLGDISSRMGSVQAIQHTLTTSFIEAIVDGLMALVTLAMMLLYSWKLALVTSLAVGLYLLLRTVAFRELRDGSERQLVAAAHQQSHLLESIRGAQSIKLAGRETLRRCGYFNLVNETVNHDVRLARLGLAFGSANQMIFGVERLVVVWIGAALAMQNVFSVGMLIAYLAYKDQFSQRIAGLIDRWVEFRMLRLHAERLSDIVLTEPEAGHDLKPREPLPAVLRIEVRGLGFRYSSSDPWVIRNCNLVVEPGESIAIAGASGCGKTTLLKLLLGLLLPTEGEIWVGGRPLTRIGMDEYRRVIGAVMQDDQLFAGCISDNIAFAEDGPDEVRVQEVAKLAEVHDDISALPMGYHSLIGDMGTSLSGGQKQRVMLARALYRRPRLLFLDEATSHLDVERERLVNDAVRGLGLTCVIIAHRPETIASADRVLVMRSGEIIQELRTGSSFDECVLA